MLADAHVIMGMAVAKTRMLTGGWVGVEVLTTSSEGKANCARVDCDHAVESDVSNTIICTSGQVA